MGEPLQRLFFVQIRSHGRPWVLDGDPSFRGHCSATKPVPGLTCPAGAPQRAWVEEGAGFQGALPAFPVPCVCFAASPLRQLAKLREVAKLRGWGGEGGARWGVGGGGGITWGLRPVLPSSWEARPPAELSRVKALSLLVWLRLPCPRGARSMWAWGWESKAESKFKVLSPRQ